MKATLPFVRDRFDHFNRLIFSGRLPEPSFRLTEATTFGGQCATQFRHHSDGHKEAFAFTLAVSTAFDLPEKELEDIIIHEMIHLLIAFNGLIDSAPHGPLFKAIMESINTAHHRKVTVSIRRPSSAPQAGRGGKWHVIAFMKLSDGKTGFKVLPRVADSILKFHKSLTSSTQVRSVEYYLSDNPFFDSFPTSSALKVHIYDAPLIMDNLRGSQKVLVTSTSVKVTDEYLN